FAGTPVTSSPPTDTRPRSGRTSPARMRSSVVLPQPLAPTSAANSPRAIRNEMSRSTQPSLDGNACEISLASRLAVASLDIRPLPARSGRLPRRQARFQPLQSVVGADADEREHQHDRQCPRLLERLPELP